MKELTCKNCSTKFKEYISRIESGHGKYCSHECLLVGREKQKLNNKCLVCEKVFYVKKSRVTDGRGKYCSPACYATSKAGMVGHWAGKTRSTPWMVGESNHFWKGGVAEHHYTRARRIGGKHTNQEWEELKKKYNNICLCCKKQEPLISLTRDHIVPVILWENWAKENKPSFLGNDIQNIQPLCRSCNSRKNATHVDFRELSVNGTNWKTTWANAV